MSNIIGPTGSSGTELAWHNEESQFEIMTWTGYNPEVGEYHATLTVWTVDDEAKVVTLERVAVRSPYEGWRGDFANPSALVPDSHKRKARAIGREKFGKERFRRLIL